MPDYYAFHIRDRVPGAGRACDRHAEIPGARSILGSGIGRRQEARDDDTNGDEKLMTGYLADLGTGGISVAIDAIPFAAYDVYAYLGSDDNTAKSSVLLIEDATALDGGVPLAGPGAIMRGRD